MSHTRFVVMDSRNPSERPPCNNRTWVIRSGFLHELIWLPPQRLATETLWWMRGPLVVVGLRDIPVGCVYHH